MPAGERCFYRHPSECLTALMTAAAVHAAERSTLSAQNDIMRKVNRGTGRRNKVKNRWRVSIMRKWLLDHWGRQLLSSGCGVLDVAGGKGELAFELVNLNGIQATVVDPRPLHLDKFNRRMRNGVYHNSVTFAPYNHDRTEEECSISAPITPQHLRMFLDKQVVAALAQLHQAVVGTPCYAACRARCRQLVAQNMARAAQIAWTEKGLVDEGHERPAQLNGQHHDHDKDNNHGPDVHLQCDFSSGDDSNQEQNHGRSCQSSGAKVDFGQTSSSCFGCPMGMCKQQQQQQQQQLEGRGSSLSEATEGQQAACVSTRTNDSDNATPVPHCLNQHTASGSSISQTDGNAGSDIAFKLPAPGCTSCSEQDDGTTTFQLDAAIDMLLGCSAVVGMHPDQAAEPIVDLAMALRKPFAVVPCCVYTADFPGRRLADGREVRSYEDLIEYLVAKDPAGNVQVTVLEHDGLNKMLTWVPPSQHEATAAVHS
eukprot:jgi/Chrzof1/12880/Cz07g10210.t1